MHRGRVSHVLLLISVCAGCQEPSPWTWIADRAATVDRTTPFALVTDAATDAEGKTLGVVVPGQGVAYRLSTPGCVQIDSLVDAQGRTWVSPAASGADYDLACQSCPQRVSLGVGSGLYVLPSSDPLPVAVPTLTLRAALRDCNTLLPLPKTSSVTIETTPVPVHRDSQLGTVQLELVITQGSVFFSDPAVLPTAVSQALAIVDTWLAPGQLRLRLLRARRLTTADPISLARGDHRALVQLHTAIYADDPLGQAPDDTRVPVVLAGCLSVRNAVTQRTTEPEGLVPAVPSGLPAPGGAHGVYVKGRGCDESAPLIDWQPESLARILAHELGHYLGLYHTVEADGSTDHLLDTDADNVMHPRPSSIDQPRWTSSQFRVMRQHPAIDWR